MIKAIITDFDGTLVDTFEANLCAYQDAFGAVGRHLTAERYRECFGFRFDRFMMAMGVFDDTEAKQIREVKKDAYSKYFKYVKPNDTLLEWMDTFHKMGGKTAIASTARKENLMNVVNYLNIGGSFDLIYAGVDVKHGKPSPEIYQKVMDNLDVDPTETLIFEDSVVGVEAAKASGAKYVKVTSEWFNRK